MDDISNRTLALLLVTAIVVSLGATVYTLNYLGRFRGFGVPTGRAPSDLGNVSLEVSNQVSIFLSTSVIDFGTGFVNTSCSLLTEYSHANLTAGATYTDDTDCWTAPEAPTSWILENNGNLNATVALRGPDNSTFFNDFVSSWLNETRVAVRSRNDTTPGGCAGTLLTSWSLMNWNSTVCSDLLWDSADSIAIDVQVWLPKDIGSGTYSNASVEFYAVQS